MNIEQIFTAMFLKLKFKNKIKLCVLPGKKILLNCFSNFVLGLHENSSLFCFALLLIISLVSGGMPSERLKERAEEIWAGCQAPPSLWEG